MGWAWSAAGAARASCGNTHIPMPLQMGTLSKAIGAYGGYLCASAPVIDLIRNRARTLIYSTGLPPSCVAAAIAALDLIEREPAYAALPVQKAKAFTKRAGLPRGAEPDRAGDHRRRKKQRSRPRACSPMKASSPPPSARPRCRPAPRACG